MDLALNNITYNAWYAIKQNQTQFFFFENDFIYH